MYIQTFLIYNTSNDFGQYLPTKKITVCQMRLLKYEPPLILIDEEQRERSMHMAKMWLSTIRYKLKYSECVSGLFCVMSR